MKKEIVTAYVGTAVSAVGTSLQFDEILRYISLGITILGGLITLATQVYNWYKRSKADGKFSKEEIKEGIDIVQTGANSIKDQLDKGKEDTK